MELIGLTETISITTDDAVTVAPVTGRIRRVRNAREDSSAITVSYGTATVELEAGDSAEFLYDGSEWTVIAALSTTALEEILSIKEQNLVETEVVILTQSDFDRVFTGTIGEDTSIYIKKKDTPYVLNYTVTLSSGVTITSDGAVVNRGIATARFVTTFRNSAVYSSGGAIGATTITRTAGTPFEEGDIISWSNSEFYSVVSDTTTTDTGGTVTVSPAIRTTAASGTIYAYTRNIHIEGWTFDGQNDVNGLGGELDAFSGRGGAFYIPYCAESRFLVKVRNCRTTSYGGAYYSENTTYNNTISNIHNCAAGGPGGGCACCSYSTISNIHYCNASDGGGCASCYYSTISNISSCSAVDGGGCHFCFYSTISNISHCSASSGGGGCSGCSNSTIFNIHSCSATIHGGACSVCSYSTISDIHNCRASSHGGACTGCSYSTIFNIHNCSALTNGGACWGCYYSIISNIHNCSASINGGGCYACHNANIANVRGCTAPTGTEGATGGVADSTSIGLQGYFDNEGYIDNIGACTYTGQFIYKNSAEVDTTVTTAAGLVSDNCD